jgi:hypothetical protein
MATNPLIMIELKKMSDYLNEIKVEQRIEEETDEEEPIE